MKDQDNNKRSRSKIICKKITFNDLDHDLRSLIIFKGFRSWCTRSPKYSYDLDHGLDLDLWSFLCSLILRSWSLPSSGFLYPCRPVTIPGDNWQCGRWACSAAVRFMYLDIISLITNYVHVEDRRTDRQHRSLAKCEGREDLCSLASTTAFQQQITTVPSLPSPT